MNNDKKIEIHKIEHKLEQKNSTIFFQLFFQLLKSSIIFLIHFSLEKIISILIIIFATFPVHFLLLLCKEKSGKPVFWKKKIVGKNGKIISIRYFNTTIRGIGSLALFYHVLNGDLAITGIGIEDKRTIQNSSLVNHKPGIFNLWYIREASRTGYEGKPNTDAEYLTNRKPIKDFKLLLRFFIAYMFKLFQGKHNHKITDPRFIFGIPLRNITMNEAITEIESSIIKKQRKKIYFVNPDCLNKTFDDSEYKDILLHHSDWIFPDGIGLNIASDMLHHSREENVNGTDMLPRLAKLSSDKEYTIFLLGAKPGIAQKMKQKMCSNPNYPNLNICGTHHGYFNHQTESEEVINKINLAKPDIVLVAFGAPYQEKWIHTYFSKLNASILIGVGGLFDFYSGTTKRAPRWLRDIGMEWSYRLLQEPKRMWKRYLIGNPVFLHRVKKVVSEVDKILQFVKTNSFHNIGILFPDVSSIPTIEKSYKTTVYLVDILPRLMEFFSANDIALKVLDSNFARVKEVENKWKQIYPKVKYNDQAKIVFFTYENVLPENMLTNIQELLKNHSVFIENNLVEKYRQVKIKPEK